MNTDLETEGARHSDPTTSRDAATSIDATTLESLCLATLRMCRTGMTTEERASAMALPLVTVSPRMRPIANKGLVYAGTKRPNASGRNAIVWYATAIKEHHT